MGVPVSLIYYLTETTLISSFDHIATVKHTANMIVNILYSEQIREPGTLKRYSVRYQGLIRPIQLRVAEAG